MKIKIVFNILTNILFLFIFHFILLTVKAEYAFTLHFIFEPAHLLLSLNIVDFASLKKCQN